MSSFWLNKQVVVVGGAGMLGHRLCGFLRDAGARVVVMDNFSRGQNRLTGVDYVRTLGSDAGDVAQCLPVFDGAGVVFNLAGSVGGVHYNVQNQASQFWSNLRLQVAPTLAASSCKVPVFMQTSSVAVYARGYQQPCQEENGHLGEPEASHAGYAWAKRMGERICAWAFCGETRWIVARPANMFGLRDYYVEQSHVIPALIGKLESGRAAQVFGGKQVREFVYADDVARGMMKLAEAGKCGEAYNLGTGGATCIAIYDLAMLVRRMLGSESEIELVQGTATGIQFSSTDCTRIHELGWRHEVGLEEGLRRVIAERFGNGK
jgi:GDP-L-fucose synthase